ncbi:L,D-transpeptidase family protein [Albimonas sp. CAU 1670]|uniref:L,D-transpeptidase family protein n=1 Tax=Albimonas sp. CAU 1670 TaxID=3032599 RepID=UPI0023DB7806|nr:L,D-transpeptidase family protein [Albimonas sp. CAU 1670]MDF2232384.1 L,D-transpeptidase family protein [Albimonas sp. CAU 1670]
MVFARTSLNRPRAPRGGAPRAAGTWSRAAARALGLLVVVGALAGCAGPQPGATASANGPAPIASAASVPAQDAPVPAQDAVVQPEETVSEVAAKQAPETYQQLMDRHGIPLQVPAQGKAILVNIPSFELIAFEDGEPVMRSRVIVGRDHAGDRTPEMTTETSVVRFRPTWRPTPSMIATGKYEDRTWPPGRNNPLGLLAIRLEPGMIIYLHGTNQPKLFEREMRALSSGCVRVERWDEVAAWVLGVDVTEVHEHANGSRTFDMDAWGVPVMMRYFTRFPDEDGELQTHPDVYHQGGSSYGMAMELAAAE